MQMNLYGTSSEITFHLSYSIQEFRSLLLLVRRNSNLHSDDTQLTVNIVHHGRVFSVAPPLALTPSAPEISTTPSYELPSGQEKPVDGALNPYFCFGFKFGHEIIYMSDVSYIPDDKWPIIESRGPNGRALPVLVLDCLRLRPHTSHFGLEDAVDTARRVAATRTYLIGFGHEVAHDDLVTLGEAVGGKKPGAKILTETVKAGLELIRHGDNVWLRPSYDGLRVFVGGDGRVHDSDY
ncbi:hypothetical protein C0992_007615 [Termitomyces sp. T32_za158]|nr:hypothetical protein C0992_007615 [Termitomyces sp. T32_za158]